MTGQLTGMRSTFNHEIQTLAIFIYYFLADSQIVAEIQVDCRKVQVRIHPNTLKL